MVAPLVGILALQGGVSEHARHLHACGAQVREVRTPEALDDLDALVLPGGESTTMTLGIAREGLEAPLRAFVRAGRPVLATCAGLILLDREHLDLLPIRCTRNAFGRQIHSFEGDLPIEGLGDGDFPGVFIRAPQVVEHDPSVQVLARVDEAVVGVRLGAVEGYAFHPELTEDSRVHRAFAARIPDRRATSVS